MSLNPKAPRFLSTSPSVSPIPMEKKVVPVLKHVKQEYEFPYTLRCTFLRTNCPEGVQPNCPNRVRIEHVVPQQKPFEMSVIQNTHFRPIRL